MRQVSIWLGKRWSDRMQRFVLIGGMLMAQSFRCYLVGCAGHVLFGIQVCLFQLLRKICVHHSLVCVDVNECVKNNGGCNSKRKCTNTDGGRTCGDCPSGWENNGVTGCKGLLCWVVSVSWPLFKHFYFAWLGCISCLVLFTGKSIHVLMYV